jgi:hypothetical protein
VHSVDAPFQFQLYSKAVEYSLRSDAVLGVLMYLATVHDDKISAYYGAGDHHHQKYGGKYVTEVR